MPWFPPSRPQRGGNLEQGGVRMSELAEAIPIVAAALMNGGVQGCDEFAAGGTVLEAARGVLEGEPVWWCKEHHASGPDGLGCWQRHSFNDGFRCRMVERTLINQGDE